MRQRPVNELVESLGRRAKNISGNWAARARVIAVHEVAPALERQLAELRAQRAVAKNDAGMWAQPRGEEPDEDEAEQDGPAEPAEDGGGEQEQGDSAEAGSDPASPDEYERDA